MRNIAKWAPGAVILLLSAVVVYAWATAPTPAVVQPIAYNHKAHLDAGLTCEFCHKGLGTEGPAAGRPEINTCKACHQPDNPVSKSPEEKKLAPYLEKDEEPPWQRIHKLGDSVYFSHFRHTTLAKLDCRDCHGDMSKSTKPLPRPVVPMSMSWCLDCHKAKKANLDCNGCHK